MVSFWILIAHAMALGGSVRKDNVATHKVVDSAPVSYTHLRAHETVLDLVCRLLLENKTNKIHKCLLRLKS